jgi:hypothetical protein
MNNTRAINRGFFRQAFLGLAVVMALTFVACQGPPGPTGATGPQGTVGPAGPSGSPNILSSPWISTEASDWVRNNIGTFILTRIAPQVTQEIVDRGSVVVFLRNFNQDTWLGNELPITYRDAINDARIFTIISPNKIQLHYVDTLADDKNLILGAAYRYVIFPPGTAIQSLYTKSYAEIAKKFNIPD